MHKLISHLLDSIFPIPCSFCGKYDLFASKLSICKQCIFENKRPTTEEIITRCKICDLPVKGDTCDFCNSRNIFFSKLHSIRTKGYIEKEMIQKIKFGNVPYLSNFFRIGLRKFLPGFKRMNFANIVIIPSNKKTLRKRPLPVCYPVIQFLEKSLRIRTISPFYKKSQELQSGKSFRERFIHAQNAFALKKEFIHSFRGNYLLVDDVFTTGATINEIAKILLQNGAENVEVLVLVKGKV